MNSVLLVNFVPWRFETGVEHLDLDQQKHTTSPAKTPTENLGTELQQKGEDIKPAKCKNIFHQIDGLMMFFPENFPNCDVLVSSLSSLNPVKSSETHEEEPASQTEALVLLELLGCRKWKAILGGKPGKQTTNVWGEEVAAVAVAALGLKVQKGGLLVHCRSLGLGLVLVKELAVVF